MHAGVRHARELAGRRAQRRSPATSTARAARCSRAPPPARRTPRRARARPGRAARPLARAACAGCREVVRRAARSPCLAEEIETPGEGQVRALITIAGNPVLSHAERRPPGRARSSALDFMVSVDIYVNETTRHADVILPGAVAARALALRPRALQLRRAQRRQLLAAGARPPTPAMLDEWETLLRLTGDRRPARAPTPTSPRSTDFVALEALRAAQTADAHSPRRTAATPTSCWPSVAPRRRARAAARPAAAHRALRARRSADLEAAPHGIDLGPLRAAPARGAAHAERQDRARARAARRRRRAAARGAGRAPSTAAWCSSAAATCARTTRGCTTCRCSSAARSAAPARPPRRRRAPRAGRRRAGARALARRRGRACRSR